MLAFEGKLKDPSSAERAKLWYPKVLRVQRLSGGLIDYIENIKASLTSKAIFSSELFNKMVSYKEDVLLIDPKINTAFQQSLGLFTRTIDSYSKTKQKSFFQNHFENASAMATMAMLNKLQFNVRNIEEKITAFCYEQSSQLTIGPCLIDFPIALMNSTVVQPAEKIVITAGIGSFYTNYNTEVFIYGKPVSVNDDGVANFNFKAESKPGKYYVPIRIKYTNLEAKQITVQKEIEYTVANIQKQ